MGKTSREKWERRYMQLLQSQQQPEAVKRSPLVWLRTTGAASMCLGLLGSFQAWYWPSIAAFYLGLLLIALDLWQEKFDRFRVFKPFALCCVGLGGVYFGKTVVFREYPLDGIFIARGDTVDVTISNPTDDDYNGLDLKLRMGKDKLIGDPEQLSQLPNVSFFSALPFESTTQGESLGQSFFLRPDGSVTDEKAYVNFLRFRCDRLPAHSGLKIRMKLLKPDGKYIVPNPTPIQEMTGEGRVQGKYREIHVLQRIPGVRL